MRAAWIRFLEVTYASTAPATLKLFTDLPGEAMTERASETIPVSAGRRTLRVTLPGTTKGRLIQPRITPVGAFELYRMRAYVYAGRWAWMEFPVLQTSDEWTPIKLPIPQTPEEWTGVKIQMERSDDLPHWIDVPVEGKYS